MCEDVIYARVSVRTVLDACSAHIRNSNCAPSFSYVKQLVRLVLGSLSGVSLCQHLRNNRDEQEESKGANSESLCSHSSSYFTMLQF